MFRMLTLLLHHVFCKITTFSNKHKGKIYEEL